MGDVTARSVQACLRHGFIFLNMPGAYFTPLSGFHDPCNLRT